MGVVEEGESMPKKRSSKTPQNSKTAKRMDAVRPISLAAKPKKPTAKSDPIYTAVALQLITHSVARCSSRKAARTRMLKTLNHVREKVGGIRQWMGPSAKLVVLPEYLLTSFPQGHDIADWAHKAALDMDGPEYEMFGEIAQENALFLAGNAYETDPYFPGFYFQTSFIIGPNGDVILRYRRLNSMFSPTPHDVWDKYLDIYGLDNVFPVVDTSIGRLAPIASEEILYPEVARCFAMRGAEVFTHSSSENASPQMTDKDAAKISRAVENIAYVVSCNTAGIHDTDLPEDASNGGSRVVDYRGRVLRVAGPGENTGGTAEIDLAALRRERRKTGLNNTLCRQRFEAYAASYAAHVFQPANSLLNSSGRLKTPQRSHFVQTQKSVISRLSKRGII